jgi:hypothetical protein
MSILDDFGKPLGDQKPPLERPGRPQGSQTGMSFSCLLGPGCSWLLLGGLWGFFGALGGLFGVLGGLFWPSWVSLGALFGAPWTSFCRS